jgi:hypothetical protein
MHPLALAFALALLTTTATAPTAQAAAPVPNGGPNALAEALAAPLGTIPFTTRAKLAVFQSAFAFGGTVRSKNVTSVSRIATGVYCVVPAIDVDLAGVYPQLTTEWTLSSGNSGLAYWRNSALTSTCPVGHIEVRTFDFNGGGAAVASDKVAWVLVVN